MWLIELWKKEIETREKQLFERMKPSYTVHIRVFVVAYKEVMKPSLHNMCICKSRY